MNDKKPTAEQMISALDCATWYNGLAEHVLGWRDLKPDRAGYILCPKTVYGERAVYKGDRDQLEVLWMIAVELFGNYGTSPRSGWIEDVNGFREWCLDITEIWRGSEEYDGPEEYRA